MSLSQYASHQTYYHEVHHISRINHQPLRIGQIPTIINNIAIVDKPAIRALAACLHRVEGVNRHADVRRKILLHCVEYLPLEDVIINGIESPLSYAVPVSIRALIDETLCTFDVNYIKIYTGSTGIVHVNLTVCGSVTVLGRDKNPPNGDQSFTSEYDHEVCHDLLKSMTKIKIVNPIYRYENGLYDCMLISPDEDAFSYIEFV